MPDLNPEKDLALCEAASPEPWEAGNVENAIYDANKVEVCFVNIRGGRMYGRSNIPFIAQSRTLLPTYIKAYQSLRAELEEARRENASLLQQVEGLRKIVLFVIKTSSLAFCPDEYGFKSTPSEQCGHEEVCRKCWEQALQIKEGE